MVRSRRLAKRTAAAILAVQALDIILALSCSGGSSHSRLNATGFKRETVGEVLVRHYLSVWEGDGSGMQILLRSAASNDAAAARMREVFGRQVLPTIAKIAPDRPAERAALVGTQLLGLGLTRYLLKLPPMVNMPAERLINELGRTLQSYIFD